MSGMSPEETHIAGVEVRELRRLGDERGSFAETYRREWLPADAGEMVQSNLSRSNAGVLRGMHFHRRQADYWVVLEGRAFVALFDLRSGSPTQGERLELEMDGESPVGLYIPPGVAHGFAARTDLTLLYLVDAYYGDGADEHGIAWDDPDWGSIGPTQRRCSPSGIGPNPLAGRGAGADPPEWVDRPAGRA